MRAMVACLIVMAFLSSALVMPRADGSAVVQVLSTQIPPSPPKTREQIASEAYGLEAQVRSVAGRKTDNSTDGTGGTATSLSNSDSIASQFLEGAFNLTTVVPDYVSTISGDDFSASFIKPFWNLLPAPTIFTLTDGYIASRDGGGGDGQYVMWSYLGPSDRNTSVAQAGGVLIGNGCNRVNVTILDSAPTSLPFWNRIKVGAEIQRACGMVGGGQEAATLYYVDASNVTRYWDGTAWNTTYVVGQFQIYTGGDRWVGIHIDRSGGNYTISINNGTTWILSATVAQVDVRNGTGDDYFTIGQHFFWPIQGCCRYYNIAKYDNWTLNPPFPDGTFVSRVLGFGDWTSLFHHATSETTGTVGIQMRRSNNSDMTNPTGWTWITSGTDYSSSNWRAGFWQYTAYLNGTSARLSSMTLVYVGQSIGDPPSKDIVGTIRHDSIWSHTTFSLSHIVDMNIGQGLNISIDHSIIDFNTDSSLRLNVSSSTSGYVNVRVTNSTMIDASYFFSLRPGVGAARIYYENSTLSDFGGSFYGAFSPISIEVVNDTNIIDYNRRNAADAALMNVKEMNRVHSVALPGQTTGDVANHIRYARYNVFDGGFLQLVWGADGTAIVNGPTSGPPVEWVNWSYNVAFKSNHTVFGFYGTSFGAFARSWTGGRLYGTVYRNYINSSRYITIQSSGNQTNWKIIGNYLQGPAASFAEAIGIFEQNHDYEIAYNYLWNMNTTNNRGIVLTDFIYNVTVHDNVIFDVGVRHIDIEGMGLKFKDTDHPNGWSDYSWKDMNVTLSDNYLSGAWLGHPAWYQDSGYIHAYNNTIVNVGGSSKNFAIFDSWNNNEDPGVFISSYAWLDWRGGYADTASVDWSGTRSYKEPYVWLRDVKLSTITIDGLPSIASLEITSPDTGHWGTLAARCVEGTESDQTMMNWTGRQCGPITDTNSADVPAKGSLDVWVPDRIMNASGAAAMQPHAHIGIELDANKRVEIIDITTGTSAPNTGGSIGWDIVAGHIYTLTIISLGPPNNAPTDLPIVALAKRDIVAFALVIVSVVVAVVVVGLVVRRDGP